VGGVVFGEFAPDRGGLRVRGGRVLVATGAIQDIAQVVQ